MSTQQLAHLNIARMKAPLRSVLMADFVAAIAGINALAERSAGFVWRLEDEAAAAADPQPFGSNILVNVSVWSDPDTLMDFVYRSGHVAVMKQRRRWFDPSDERSMVLWWVPYGHRPTVVEARERLERLHRNGATAEAFDFGALHGPDGCLRGS